MVGVNSGDGRGNLTAYATVFDSEAVLQGDRDYSACSVNGTPRRLLHLRRLLGQRGRHIHTDFAARLYRGHRRSFRPSDALSNTASARPLQLWAAQPLPASGAPLQPRRDGPLRVRRARRRVHAAHVQRLRVDRPGRPGRQLLQYGIGQLRQPVPAGQQPCRHRLRRGGSRERRLGDAVHRAAQRRGRRPPADLRELLVPHGRGRARRHRRGLGLRRLGAVLERLRQHGNARTTSSRAGSSARSTSSTSTACRPAAR